MRRSARHLNTNSAHTPHSRSELDAGRAIRDLQERVSRLERRITEQFGPEVEELSAIHVAAERKRPGPKPAYNGMFLFDRDRLVEMLECFWPEIEPLCSPQPKARALKAMLGAIASREQQLPANQASHLWAVGHLLRHLPQLVQFLSGDRFRRDPRQIANAFAAVPQVSLWRSLKLCQAKPCNHVIGQRAIRAYIEKKHPNLYYDLLAEESLIKFVTAMRRYRSKDRQLAAFPAKHLYYCWKKCIADPQLIAGAKATHSANEKGQYPTSTP